MFCIVKNGSNLIYLDKDINLENFSNNSFISIVDDVNLYQIDTISQEKLVGEFSYENNLYAQATFTVDGNCLDFLEDGDEVTFFHSGISETRIISDVFKAGFKAKFKSLKLTTKEMGVKGNFEVIKNVISLKTPYVGISGKKIASLISELSPNLGIPILEYPDPSTNSISKIIINKIDNFAKTIKNQAPVSIGSIQFEKGELEKFVVFDEKQLEKPLIFLNYIPLNEEKNIASIKDINQEGFTVILNKESDGGTVSYFYTRSTGNYNYLSIKPIIDTTNFYTKDNPSNYITETPLKDRLDFIHFYQENLENKKYVIHHKCPYAYKINELCFESSGGMVEVKFLKNGQINEDFYFVCDENYQEKNLNPKIYIEKDSKLEILVKKIKDSPHSINLSFNIERL